MDSHPAVAHVGAVADSRRARDLDRIHAVLDGSSTTVDDIVGGLRRHGRLTVNFHPDRRDRRGLPVVEGLLRDGAYRSQLVTGISNGQRFAADAEGRWRWERELFGAVYDDHDDDHDGDRPIYGALDLTHDPHGGSPRFGSCALVLADSVWKRATFTVGDSHLAPTDVGTAASFIGVVAGLLEGALGGRGLDGEQVEAIARSGPVAVAAARDLDHYVEMQVHGGLELDEVVAVLADPSFRDGAVGRGLRQLAETCNAELVWHQGSVVEVDNIAPDFRGPATLELAHELADARGLITAAAIGASIAAIEWTPPRPDGDPSDGPLQLHKYLWHAVLALGQDAALFN